MASRRFKAQHQPDAILFRGLTRRQVLKRATAIGLTAPAIAGLLAACGGDDGDQATSTATSSTAPTASIGGSEPSPTTEATSTTTSSTAPTASIGGSEPSPTTEASTGSPTSGSQSGHGRGRVELLRMLNWQAPTILNSHLASGGKDTNPAALVLEPLIDFAPDGSLVPKLVAELPSLENGGLAADGLSVTYALREGVVWSDGEPFTAEDVKFTWEYVTNPDTAATTVATYQPIDDIEVVDQHTVTVKFNRPNPGWFVPFGGCTNGVILPKHILEEFTGENSRNAAFNLQPIGTGPYKVTEFRPGDLILYVLNETYREPDKPYFSRVEWKGGGDAVSAARAVLQSGETDWAWTLQVEKQILEDLSARATTGMLQLGESVDHERIMLNFADPNTEVDGARSEPSTQHPFLSDLKVRQAFALAVDRDTIAQELYGEAGVATANVLNMPPAFTSKNTRYEFNLDQAAQLLDEAGWVRDGDSRSKDGVSMQILFQTTANSVRQKNQEIVKQAFEQIGVPIEIKAIDSGVFFSADPGNPDTGGKFYADFQMYSTGPDSLFPIGYMARYKSTDPDKDLSQKANSWTGPNENRWINAEYNEMYEQLEAELDQAKQSELFIAMNDLVVNEVVDIVEVHRNRFNGVNTKLRGNRMSPWTTGTWDIADWYFEE